MSQVTQIIKGYTNLVLNNQEELMKNRLKICYRCPLYSSKMGGICNNRLWLNVNTGDVSTESKSGYKRGCGCILHSKTRVPEAKCPVGKW